MKRLRILAIYPGPEREGRSALALHRLEQLAGRRSGLDVDRVFWKPGPRRVSRSRSRRELWLFSAAHEQQLVMLPALLESSGIEPLAARRHPRQPVVVAGGMALSLNPATVVPFLDAWCRGDAEPVLQPLLEQVARWSGSRAGLWEALARVPGLSSPAGDNPPLFYDGPEPACQRRPEPGAVFERLLLLETGRGCPVRCRFCAVGHQRPRAHFFAAADVLAIAREIWRPGLRLGLVGAGLSWHPQLLDIVSGLEHFGADLSPASLDLRLLASSRGRPLLEHLGAAGHRTATLAPEAGSYRLRRVLGKPSSDEMIEAAVRGLVEAGVLHLKLYLMYGLPGEQDADLEAAIALVARVRRWMDAGQRPRGRAGRLQVSANPFVPKPGTPWAAHPVPEVVELRRRARLLRQGMAALGGVTFSGLSPRLAVWQCLLDRAGPEAARLLQALRGRWPPSRQLAMKHLPGWRELVHGRGERQV